MSTYYPNRHFRTRAKPKAPPVHYLPVAKQIDGDPEVVQLLKKAGIQDLPSSLFDSPTSKMLLKYATEAYHYSLMEKKELIESIYFLLASFSILLYDSQEHECDCLHNRIYRKQLHIQELVGVIKGDKTPNLFLNGLFASLRAAKNLNYTKVKPTYVLGWILDIIRYVEITSEQPQLPSLTSDLVIKEYSSPVWHTQHFKMKAFAANWPMLVKSKVSKQKGQ